jgi:hypothetical protein
MTLSNTHLLCPKFMGRLVLGLDSWGLSSLFSVFIAWRAWSLGQKVMGPASVMDGLGDGPFCNHGLVGRKVLYPHNVHMEFIVLFTGFGSFA